MVFNSRRTVESEPRFRPFVVKHICRYYVANDITEPMRTKCPIVPHKTSWANKRDLFLRTNGKHFYVLALISWWTTISLATPNASPSTATPGTGRRVSNIPSWGIDRINNHYRQEWGDAFETLAGPDGITAEEIFAYTYAVLHDPAYRHEYAVDLLRDFPRLPLYHGVHHLGRWARSCWTCTSGSSPPSRTRWSGTTWRVDPKRVILRADKAAGDDHPGRAHHAGGHSPRPGSTGWAAAPPWSGCWTSTKRRNPGTRPS